MRRTKASPQEEVPVLDQTAGRAVDAAALDESPGIDRQAEPRLEDEEEQLEIPGLSPAFERIVERVFEVDVETLDQELDGKLRTRLPPSAMNKTAILDALEEGDESANTAMRLAMIAARAKDDFDIDVKLIEAQLRGRARQSLEDDLGSGDRKKKSITKQDLEDWVAEHYQDHHASIEKQRSKLKRACEYFEQRASLFKNRANHLDTIARGTSS